MILAISLASIARSCFLRRAIQKKDFKTVKVSNKNKKLDCHALMPGLPSPTKAKSVGLAIVKVTYFVDE
jgi:hypothetical protein